MSDLYGSGHVECLVVHGETFYTTMRGDTLWYVSFVRLGTASRWEEIRDLNDLELGPDDTLEPGIVLLLPT